MGEVYLVEHPRLPRRDALKILLAEVSAGPHCRAHFQHGGYLASDRATATGRSFKLNP